MSNLVNDLCYRPELWRIKEEGYTNEFGEDDTEYEMIKKVWAGIRIIGGTERTAPGEMEYSEITHKFTVRSQAIPHISNSMFFIFRGQRYDIKYFLPNYKNNDRIEIYCKLEVET